LELQLLERAGQEHFKIDQDQSIKASSVTLRLGQCLKWSIASVWMWAADFRSSPGNGLRQTGSAGPVRADCVKKLDVEADRDR